MPDDQQRDQDRDDNDEVHRGGHLAWLTDQGGATGCVAERISQASGGDVSESSRRR
jgi:hypothetical protein